jgi:hypothetical protein
MEISINKHSLTNKYICTPLCNKDILSWFWPNKSLSLLFNAASLAVKQQIYILSVYGLTHLRFTPTIALVVSMLTITLSTDMVQKYDEKQIRGFGIWCLSTTTNNWLRFSIMCQSVVTCIPFAASLAVKQQIYILSVYGLTHLRFAPTIALVVSMLTITLSTDMVQMNLLLQMNN